MTSVFENPPENACKCGQPDCNRWWGGHGPAMSPDEVHQYIIKYGHDIHTCSNCGKEYCWDENLQYEYDTFIQQHNLKTEPHLGEFCSLSCHDHVHPPSQADLIARGMYQRIYSPPAKSQLTMDELKPAQTIQDCINAALRDFRTKNSRTPAMIVMSKRSLLALLIEVNRYSDKDAKSHLHNMEKTNTPPKYANLPIKMSPGAHDDIICTDTWPLPRE